jgi:hypothetical protein
VQEIPTFIPRIDEILNEKKEELSENVGEIVGDLFYNSMKEFFDFGKKLAENLTNEYSKEEK